MTELKYKHTPDMGEISGFGGDYEETCQIMLNSGILWFDEHTDSNPQFKGNKNVYGIIIEDNDDAKALSKAITKPLSGSGGCTGAMHHAVIERLLFIKNNSWEKYCEHLRKYYENDNRNNQD